MLSKGVRPQNPAQHLRGSSRRCSGAGQDRGVQAIMPRQETCRDAVCAFEAYPTARPAAIARAMRCPVRVHVGSDCAEPSQACQVGRPATTTRPCVLCVTLQASVKSSVSRPAQSSGWQRTASTNGISRPAPSVCRLLQQNLHETDIPARPPDVCFQGVKRKSASASSISESDPKQSLGLSYRNPRGCGPLRREVAADDATKAW